MGLAFQLCLPLYSGQAVAVHTPQDRAPPPVPNSDNVLEVAKMVKCTALLTLPAFVEVRVHCLDTLTLNNDRL